jgi:hypothetical protein
MSRRSSFDNSASVAMFGSMNTLPYELGETFNAAAQADAVIAEYVWIGGSGMDLRSKARTFTNGTRTVCRRRRFEPEI